MRKRRKKSRTARIRRERSKRSKLARRQRFHHQTKRIKTRRHSLSRKQVRRKRHRRHSRLMVTFSRGERHVVKLSRWMASKNGTYLNAVRRLLHTNDRGPLEQFAAQSIKDVRGKVFPFETRPNVLYRLNSVPGPFHEIYQVLT